jgi:hypothetical protein
MAHKVKHEIFANIAAKRINKSIGGMRIVPKIMPKTQT